MGSQEVPVPRTIDDVTLPWLQKIFSLINIQVISYKLEGDARDGRGFLSSLNRLTLQVQRADESSPSPLSIVIKTVPTDPQVYAYVIRVGYCANEFEMYTKVLPAIAQVLDEQGVSSENRFSYPRCYYGADEEGSTSSDYRSVLVLEDLLDSGYTFPNVGTTKAFDVEETKAALTQIARFHASSLVYKKCKELRFYRDAFPRLLRHNVNDPMLGHYVHNGFDVIRKMLMEGETQMPDGLIERLKQLEQKFKEIATKFYLDDETTDFHVIRHSDLWYSNVSLLRDDSGKLKKTQWFDFQNCNEGAAMLDVGFFLILNCDSELSTTRLKEMISHYHHIFTSVLKEAKIQLDYKLEQMMHEFREIRMPAIVHIISGAPGWCGPNTNELTKERLRKAIVYAFTNRELELPKFD